MNFILLLLLIYILLLVLLSYSASPIILKFLKAISKLYSKSTRFDCVIVRRCEDKCLNYCTLVLPIPQHHSFSGMLGECRENMLQKRSYTKLNLSVSL